MTIKQQGGVFGRHPSFSTLEVDGQSTLGPVFAENAGTALTATRTGSEGEIAAWYKDSTKVAGLNVMSGDAWLNVPDRAGLRFSGTSLVPLKNGAVADAQISLGSPIYRFNTLYLSGNVVIGINSGIDFSATSGTGTSELFDDYEEGIHTAAVTCGTSGTISLQSNTSLAYTKVGDIVHVQGYLYVGSVSSPTGSIRVSVPFAASNLTGGGGSAAASVWMTNVNTANVADFVARIAEGNSYIEIELGDAVAAQADSAQEVKTGTQIWLSATYKAA